MYFKLSEENKRKTKRPIHPHDPYLRLMKNNKVFYKLRTELTKEDELLIPPPPPVPNATKEEILKAKKAYKDWKKRTGNDIPPPPPPRETKKKASFNFKKSDNNQIIVTADKIDKLKNKTSKVKYYLDGKLISKEEVNKIETYNIKSMRVEKSKKDTGSGSIYIITKK